MATAPRLYQPTLANLPPTGRLTTRSSGLYLLARPHYLYTPYLYIWRLGVQFQNIDVHHYDLPIIASLQFNCYNRKFLATGWWLYVLAGPEPPGCLGEDGLSALDARGFCHFRLVPFGFWRDAALLDDYVSSQRTSLAASDRSA